MSNELSCNQYCLNTNTTPSYAKSMSSLTSSLVEVHIVHKGDEYYTKGRKLAENVYRQVWGTENLLDGNDYGVIVSQNGKILGNINIQLRRSRDLLKSEVFFGKRHWQNYSDSHHAQIGELSALALAQDVPKHLRRPTMMTLILGIYLICHAENINFVATVQHDYLIRILSKSLHLPFFRNEYVQHLNGEVPNDNYWNRGKLPRLYYFLPDSLHTINACASFLNRLPKTKIIKSHFPAIEAGRFLDRSAFPAHWDRVKNYDFAYAS